MESFTLWGKHTWPFTVNQEMIQHVVIAEGFESHAE